MLMKIVNLKDFKEHISDATAIANLLGKKLKEINNFDFELKPVGVTKDDLSVFPTSDLVEELKSREDVKVTVAEFHQDKDVHVSGPATALVIADPISTGIR